MCMLIWKIFTSKLASYFENTDENLESVARAVPYIIGIPLVYLFSLAIYRIIICEIF